MMLALKIFLVPGFLLLVSLATRRWGAKVGGVLAGLPVSAGPIFFVIYLENGSAFTAAAASTGLSSVFASLAYCVVFSHASRCWGTGVSLLCALLAWAGAASLVVIGSDSPAFGVAIAFGALLAAPLLFPRTKPLSRAGQGLGTLDLCLRMLAGALLTLSVSVLSAILGPRLTGVMAAFPVMAIVLSYFSHQAFGSDYVVMLLRSMAYGLYSFAVFCLSLSMALPRLSAGSAFVIAVLLSSLVPVVIGRYVLRK